MNDAAETVLIVDDDPLVLQILSAQLRKSGYDVEQVRDGPQALDAIGRRCPNFVITDWEMSPIDGPELCRRIRAMSLPHYVFIVFASARAKTEDVIEGLEAGADDFLIKPIMQQELLARLRAGSRVISLERRLNRLAKSDSLTGLDTKRTFFGQLEKAIGGARRYNQQLACVMLDADFFKRINDTYGHPAGDEVLKTLGQILRENSRVSDLLCRYGGEEFVALLPETDEEHASLWAERLRKRIARHEFRFDGDPIRMTCSLGVAQLTDEVTSDEQLVEHADRALLAAKQSGRDRVVSYSTLAGRAARIDERLRGECQDLFHGTTAADAMTTFVAPLQADDTIEQAVGHFLRSRMTSAPVVDDDGRLVGILTEKDVMNVILAPDVWQRPASEVMKSSVVCYPAHTPLATVYEFLCRVSIRQVIIVEDDRPVGAIHRVNIVRWFANWMHARGHDTADSDARHGRTDRSAIIGLAQRLTDEATGLEDRLADPEVELVPVMVDGASRLQEVVNDLLSWSRHAHESSFAAAETGGALAAAKAAAL